MHHPVITANYCLFNTLNTIAFASIIFCLVMSIVRTVKESDKKRVCKHTLLCKMFAIAAFILLIISGWVSLKNPM